MILIKSNSQIAEMRKANQIVRSKTLRFDGMP